MVDGGVFVAVGLAMMVVGVVASFRSMHGARRVARLQQTTSEVLNALPGGNCGMCGNDSCFATARDIAAGRLPVSHCVAGGARTAEAVKAALTDAGGPVSGRG